jgi:hypothetical protein
MLIRIIAAMQRTATDPHLEILPVFLLLVFFAQWVTECIVTSRFKNPTDGGSLDHSIMY